MDQKTFLEVTAMLNSFPQGSADPDVLLASIERATANIDTKAIAEAAQRFTSGLVEGQHKTFAPSVAEFCTEVRRIASLLPYRGIRSIAPPSRQNFYQEPKPQERIRMGFKLSLLSASLCRAGGADILADVNKGGLRDLVALGEQCGVPVPAEVYAEIGRSAA